MTFDEWLDFYSPDWKQRFTTGEITPLRDAWNAALAQRGDVPRQSWTPCSEQLPPHELEFVLAVGQQNEAMSVKHVGAVRESWVKRLGANQPPFWTHWMPLPDAPVNSER